MWTVDQANEWYDAQPWICGLNYIPAHTISYTEMWMDYAWDLKRIDAELALAEDIGINALRVVLPFVVWEAEPEAFQQRFEEFLTVADKRGMRVAPCFFDDCAFGEKGLENPKFGQQPDVLEGWYASGWTPSPGHDRVRDESVHPALERYVKSIMTAHKDDKRILMWDLYNEPTNSEMMPDSLPLLDKVFAWAREINPSQPITSGLWHPRVQEILLEKSDVITFHHYESPEKLRAFIHDLKKHGRPLINTEWLNRAAGSTVEGCLPVFKEERVGCMHWGLVNGRTQTHLGWGSRPDRLRQGEWQHDLFHNDHTPYRPEELKLFKKLIEEA